MLGKYRKSDMAADLGITAQDLSKLFTGKRALSVNYANKLSDALTKHGIQVTPGHILDGLSQDNWELIPRRIVEDEANGSNMRDGDMRSVISLLLQIDNDEDMASVKRFIELTVAERREKSNQKNMHSAS